MSGALAVLGTAWRTFAFGLSFGRLLLASFARAGIGLLVGLLLFTFIAELAPPDYRGHARTIGAVLTALAFGVSTFLKGFRQAAPPDVMGSAAWATPKGIAAALATPTLAADPAALLVGRGYGQPGPLLRYAGPAHLLTIAPTRSGKGVGTILPNLLLANRSMICVDPKGENARIAARARARFGPVFVLDPFGASGQPSASYDPAATLDPRSPDLAEEATTLADALVYDPPGQAGEAHWNEEARALIAGLLMHLACRGTPDRRGLGELRRLLTLPPREWDALLHAMMADTDAGGGLGSRHRTGRIAR